MASQFIGARISLVSKSDIRYVGTLHSISQEDSTIALENVRSYGTEDRRPPAEKIDPSPSVFEYILFRASDVKDLQVEEHKQRANDVPNDPAIISSSRAHAPQPANSSGSLTGPRTYMDQKGTNWLQQAAPEPAPVTAQAFARPYQRSRSVANGEVNNSSDGQNDNRGGNLPGMGVHLLHNRRGRGGRHFDKQARNGPRPPLPAPDFDFESANAKFDKGRLVKEVGDTQQDGKHGAEEWNDGEESTPVARPEVYYDKSSFFDNISCETKERQQIGEEGRSRGPGDRRARQLEERRLNVETFGQTSVDGVRHRRNFRGRGGYRGGFRGAPGGVHSGGGGVGFGGVYRGGGRGRGSRQ